MVRTDKLKRAVTLSVASLLFLASVVPFLSRQKANAYELMGSREIRMSSSAPGTQPDGEDVTYRVTFDLATAGTVQGIVVAFCENSPIIEDTVCDLPAGFTLTDADLGLGNLGDHNLSGWTFDTAVGDTAATAGSPNTVILTNTPGITGAIDDTLSFEIDGITNPDAINSTFYARIYTYAAAADAEGYTLADPNDVGPSIDAGGIALSTAQQLTVRAKVQERLTFCVYTFPIVGGVDTPANDTTDNNCDGKAGSTVILGDQNGVLDSAGPYVDKTAYYSITTNAVGNAAIRLKGDTLSSGSATIDAIGDTPALSAPAGTAEQFGFCTYQHAGAGLLIVDGTGGDADYTGSGTGGAGCAATTQTAGLAGGTGGDGGASFTFDTSANGTTSQYGQVIARKPAGGFSTGRLAFIGNITDVTDPGIYETTLTFIATGTY